MRKSTPIKEAAMPKIVCVEGYRRTLSRVEFESLRSMIADRVPDHDVEIQWYQDDSGILPSLFPAIIESILVNVPWEVLSGAAASVFLDSVTDWIAGRIQARKSRHEAEREEFKRRFGRLGDLRPLLPQEVRILGPKGQTIGVVYGDDEHEVPAIVTGRDVEEFYRTLRRRQPWDVAN